MIKSYDGLEMEVIVFSKEDVISTSCNPVDDAGQGGSSCTGGVTDTNPCAVDNF